VPITLPNLTTDNLILPINPVKPPPNTPNNKNIKENNKNIKENYNNINEFTSTSGTPYNSNNLSNNLSKCENNKCGYKCNTSYMDSINNLNGELKPIESFMSLDFNKYAKFD
jgi:hypothetical protein